uniref:Uncharacterized protein n=1 Tax=Nelumbo nucifera TaxID=4432 RepID=A0A822XP53_NELNU|nr:TPA_asm: hypothetical protein HUJ06_020741 [Nelumbo nucifera]
MQREGGPGHHGESRKSVKLGLEVVQIQICRVQNITFSIILFVFVFVL